MEKLIIRAAASASYTFTGNNRNASFSPNSARALSFSAISNYDGGTSVKFKPGSVLKVTRARLLSSGAPGMNAAPGSLAATLSLGFSGSSQSASLAFSCWNEWEQKSITLVAGNGPSLDEITLQSGSSFSVDDFNIQEDFIGQSTTPILELEVERGSVVKASNGAEY